MNNYDKIKKMMDRDGVVERKEGLYWRHYDRHGNEVVACPERMEWLLASDFCPTCGGRKAYVGHEDCLLN